MKIMPIKIFENIMKHRWLLSLALALLCFGLFLDLTVDFYEGDLTQLDESILRIANNLRVGWLNGIAVDLTAFGSSLGIGLLVSFATLLLWLLCDRKSIFQLLLSVGSSFLLSLILKGLVSRPRPNVIPRLVEVSGFSYPSGHALVSSATYVTLALILFRYFPKSLHRGMIFTFLVVLSGFVGLSRIYLGVHYPSDVLSAFSLGIGWALLFDLVLRQFFKTQLPAPCERKSVALH